MKANSGCSDQTPRSAASDLCLYCFPMSHKRTLGIYWLKVEKVTNSLHAGYFVMLSLSSADVFLLINFLKKIKNTFRVTQSLDPDQGRRSEKVPVAASKERALKIHCPELK